MLGLRALLTLGLVALSRGAKPNCTDPDSGATYLNYLNATGSANTTGWKFQDNGGVVSGGNWTWIVGVATTKYEGSRSKYEIEQRLWLHTSPPQDLEQASSKYSGCVYVLQGWKSDLQKKGQHDKGDCTSMLSRDCIAAIKKTATDAALLPHPYSNCPYLGVPQPCQGEVGKHWQSGDSTQFINSTYKGCKASGNGTMNDGFVMNQYESDNGFAMANLLPYDTVVTGVTVIVPVVVGNNSKTADTRVVCVVPSTIVGNSRRPEAVPSLGSRAVSMINPTYIAIVEAVIIAMII